MGLSDVKNVLRQA